MDLVHLCTSASVVARGRDCKVHAASPKRAIVATQQGEGSLESGPFLFFIVPHTSLLSLGDLGGGRHPNPRYRSSENMRLPYIGMIIISCLSCACQVFYSDFLFRVANEQN